MDDDEERRRLTHNLSPIGSLVVYQVCYYIYYFGGTTEEGHLRRYYYIILLYKYIDLNTTPPQQITIYELGTRAVIARLVIKGAVQVSALLPLLSPLPS